MQANQKFLLGYGAGKHGETRAITFSSGKTNPSENAGTPYRTVTWEQIVRSAANPQTYRKVKAPFIIPSAYHGFDGRTHDVQREKGSFWLLALDFDEHTPLETLEAALKKILGDVEWLAYSTSSATAEKQKMRGLIPLSEPLAGVEFTSTQEAFFELLEAEGLEPDLPLSRPGQPIILPNRGEWYHYKHQTGTHLKLTSEHPIAQLRSQKETDANARRVERPSYSKPFETNDDDLISALNSIHPDINYFDWLRIGMALKTELGEHGFHLWDSWSAHGSNYDSHIMRSKWNSFHEGGGVSIGTLFHFAKQAGWQRSAWTPIKTAKPFKDPDALPNAKDARESLRGAVEAFHRINAGTMSLTEFPAPLHVLEASLGLGKTTTALKATVERIRHLRQTGDDAGAAVVLVPMHRLSEQVKADLQKMAPDLSVEILRGVEAQDPFYPKESVCKNLDEYRKAQRLLTETPCGSCPFAESCLFMKGKETKADVYIKAHGALAAKAAPAIKWRQQYLDHVIIDESPLSALIFGTGGGSNIGLSAWRSARLPANPDSAADLATWRAKVEEAARANGEGPLDALWLDAVGLTASIASEAAGLEWQRKVELDPNASKEQRRKQKVMLKENTTVRISSGIWRAIADLLDSDKDIGGQLYVLGDPEKGLTIELQGVRGLHESYDSAPILALDATADAAVAEAVLRRPAARVDVIRAAEPMLQITQDAAFSGSKALLLDSPTDKGKKACENNRRRLETFIARKARKIAPERLLFIGNKDLVELLELPKNVVTAHFNALRGLNTFEGVAAAVIVGRPQPNERAVNRMASAIFDRHIEDRIDWKAQIERSTVDGPMMAKASMHPDADAHRVLTLTRDAEVEQAIGRLRAVNRTKPVEVLLLSDAVIRQTVKLSRVWRDVVRKADPIEQMLLEGGIAYLSPAHAAKAYPERWKSLNAAKYALSCSTGEKKSLVESYDLFSPVVVLYRLPRAKDPVVAVLDARKHPIPQLSLERELGPLAHFEVLETTLMPEDSAVEQTVKRLEDMAKAVGYRPKVTIRTVETPVFVAGVIPVGVQADAFRRKGFKVDLVEA